LERVVAEIRHLSGDAVLDLGESESVERRAFIDALLDSEANTLDESFRQALFAHTGGQALFTVEILRYLQDRGNIFQEEDGAWTADKTLAWDALPDRVEGVIEARIGRLEDELRELLNVAAVEGEEFTAQVVARVQAIDERGLLRMLSNQLDKKHQLVRESSALKHGRHLLSRYRFSHTLFQQYLYNDLSQSERQLLHGDIAAILEELYEGRTDEIAVLLARHYRAAGEDDRALPYLLQSGDQARGLYAFEQAAQYYGDALQILRRDGDPDTVYQLLMKLAQTYHSVFEYDRSAELYREAFQYSEVGANPPTNKKPSASLRRVRCELRYIGQPFQTLDYADTTSAHDHLFITHLFSGLLQTSPNLDVLPDIAASWQISDDGLTYTFFLRDDVVWSDGQPVTAHDFEFAWRRVLDRRRSSPNTGLLADLRGATNFLAGESARLGIRALDNWTLQINLERPAAYFLHLLSHFGFPLPRHVVEAHGDDWWAIANLVTNGPFVLERLPLEWCAGESVLLRRNPAYHGWFPGNLDQIELPIFSSTSGSLREYENNKLDLMPIGGWWGRSRLPISEYRRVLQIHGPEVHTFPQLSTAMVVFDTSRPPFDDVRVRRAFARAADRQSFAGDRLEVASGGLVPPGLPGHVADIALPYDVDEAKRLLAKAGYPAGRGFPPVKGALHESLKDTIGFFDRVWCDVLDVTVRWEPAKDVVMAPIEPYALVLLAWSADYPDPDNFLRFFLRNSSNWSNDTYDRLLEEASRTMVQRERLRLYRQAEQILVEEVPVLPLVYGQTEWLVKPWIKNWRPGHFMSLSTQYIMVEPH
jgi:oligopeptide transport system substrate-binding protein